MYGLFFSKYQGLPLLSFVTLGGMMGNIFIKEIDTDKIDEVLDVLHKSFEAIAKEINLTRNNSPLNNAFLKRDELIRQIDAGLKIYGCIIDDKIVGCIGIMPSTIKDEYYLEKLCVLPENRHNKIGTALLEYSEKQIRNCNGKTILISIINKNGKIKQWAALKGFEEIEICSFVDLPYEVCVMKMENF
jgi:ribosomal protein S18 acetylase RimI-like enzyme